MGHYLPTSERIDFSYFYTKKMPDLSRSRGAAAGSRAGRRPARSGVRERMGGWGRWRGLRTLALSRQPAWRDRLVAPVHVARQGGSRHRRRDAALARATSVATLSRHMQWRDRGYLSRHAAWRDQTGYALQIKTNTG